MARMLLMLSGAPGVGKSSFARGLLGGVDRLAEEWSAAGGNGVSVWWVEVDRWRSAEDWSAGRMEAERRAMGLLVSESEPRPCDMVASASSWSGSPGSENSALRIVVLDDVNASLRARRKWAADARECGFQLVELRFHASIHALLASNVGRERDKRLPERVVRNEYQRLQFCWQEQTSVDVLHQIAVETNTSPDLSNISRRLVDAAVQSSSQVERNGPRPTPKAGSELLGLAHRQDLELRKVVAAKIAASPAQRRSSLGQQLSAVKRSMVKSGAPHQQIMDHLRSVP